MPSAGFTKSIYLLSGYRIREFLNIFRFGDRRTWFWAASITLLGLSFVWFDHLFFARLIGAIQEKLEFLAPFMLHQLIHTLFLSFFGLLALSSLSSSISGFYMSREIPLLVTTPRFSVSFYLPEADTRVFPEFLDDLCLRRATIFRLQ